MKIENWFEACKEMPEHPGEYIIKYDEKEAGRHVFYLKAGEKLILKTAPFNDKPESSILFALSNHVLQVKAVSAGFYACDITSDGREILSYLAPKGLLWSVAKKKVLNYRERKKRLKDYLDEEYIPREVLKSEIISRTNSSERIQKMYDKLLNSFKNGFYDFCGTRYIVSPVATDNSFLKALRYRDIIISLSEYPNIGKLSQIAFSEDAKGLFSLTDALALRDDLCLYLRSRGENNRDVEMISDAYFIHLFIPTKKDMVKVLFDNERLDVTLSKEMLVTKVFQRYQIINSIRSLGILYSTPKNSVRDGMIDVIATIQMAQVLAISMFKIKEFKENFKMEMGI